MTTVSGTATGHITVKTYEPKPYNSIDGAPDLVRVSVTETFHGDIEGDGEVEFLQVISRDGSASFVGVERVVGTLGHGTVQWGKLWTNGSKTKPPW